MKFFVTWSCINVKIMVGEGMVDILVSAYLGFFESLI